MNGTRGIDNDTIRNERLSVTFRLPRRYLYSRRFDSSGCIARICFDGEHQFCEPEQVLTGRPDSHGLGLVGEFVADQYGTEARVGEWFPKYGVGLLRQLEELQPYDYRKEHLYEARPFPVEYHIAGSRAEFIQRALPGNDRALQITRTYVLSGTQIILDTSVDNVGSKPVDLCEYQHNFVSIDHIPIGPGYRLQTTFDKAPERNASCTGRYGHLSDKVPVVLGIEDGSIVWQREMDGIEFSRVPDRSELDAGDVHRWKLSHDGSSAALSESLSGPLEKVVFWAIEQCICVEMYTRLSLEPGQTGRIHREWTFSCT